MGSWARSWWKGQSRTPSSRSVWPWWATHSCLVVGLAPGAGVVTPDGAAGAVAGEEGAADGSGEQAAGAAEVDGLGLAVEDDGQDGRLVQARRRVWAGESGVPSGRVAWPESGGEGVELDGDDQGGGVSAVEGEPGGVDGFEELAERLAEAPGVGPGVLRRARGIGGRGVGRVSRSRVSGLGGAGRVRRGSSTGSAGLGLLARPTRLWTPAGPGGLGARSAGRAVVGLLGWRAVAGLLGGVTPLGVGVGLEVGLEPGGDVVGDAGVDVGGAVAAGAEGDLGGRGGAFVGVLEELALIGLGQGGVDGLEDPAAQGP